MDSARTLLLTPWFTPHKVISWQHAVSLLWDGKIEVLEEYDEILRSPSIEINMPAVVRLKKINGSMKRGVKFSRVNVLTRDKFTCQYCGTSDRTAQKLNFDHVVPRSQGGKTHWENIVMSCYACNSKKRDRTPEQAGMTLLTRPHKPDSLPLHRMVVPVERAHPLWVNWLSAA